MFKTLIVVVFCAIALAQCMPSDDTTIRFARQTEGGGQSSSDPSQTMLSNPMALGINVATQMGSAAAEAAHGAIKVGEQAMQGMAQAATTGTQLFPGFG